MDRECILIRGDTRRRLIIFVNSYLRLYIRVVNGSLMCASPVPRIKKYVPRVPRIEAHFIDFLEIAPFFLYGWIWLGDGIPLRTRTALFRIPTARGLVLVGFRIQRTVSCFWCLSVCVGRGVGFWVTGPRFLDFLGLGPCLYRFLGLTDHF